MKLAMESVKHQKTNWSIIDKIAFRVIFSYVILFILLLFTALLFEGFLRWFADIFLGWGSDFSTESTGSGDRSFDYVRFALNLVLALLVGLIWTIADRKRHSYNTLFYWFQVILRVALFVAMLFYGLAKVFNGQFGSPSLELLMQSVGEMSPMGLAWTFMGYSLAYSIFIGFIEILGGVLLLYRKTQTIGSLIIVGVMTNVVVMNLIYDIPVKLFSMHLTLMAIILLWPDRYRIINMFFKNKTVEKIEFYKPLANGALKKVIRGGRGFVVVLLTLILIVQCFVQFELREQLKSKSEFYGIWESQLFIKNKDTIPPLLTDTYRWRYLIVDLKKKAAIKKMNDSIDRYQFKFDTVQKKIVFNREADLIPQHFFYNLNDDTTLELKGVLDGDSLQVYFKRKPESDFRLINRKFHWVNESTYNY
ncbi:DoxX family protein [uncultured Psychroserpens sp.]|uniref:DoxX family protein n=1 Tax=uncultured Psychroserpens sp. TaxID=255436 RepID=UPI0026272E64|nr:DoxX family protein [uncultured Psychroserpens sp.]